MHRIGRFIFQGLKKPFVVITLPRGPETRTRPRPRVAWLTPGAVGNVNSTMPLPHQSYNPNGLHDYPGGPALPPLLRVDNSFLQQLRAHSFWYARIRVNALLADNAGTRMGSSR